MAREDAAARRDVERSEPQTDAGRQDGRGIDPGAGTPEQAHTRGGDPAPPHPALMELVRLLARVDARRRRAEERERR
jgi:hypothetical protein